MLVVVVFLGQILGNVSEKNMLFCMKFIFEDFDFVWKFFQVFLLGLKEVKIDDGFNGILFFILDGGLFVGQFFSVDGFYVVEVVWVIYLVGVVCVMVEIFIYGIVEVDILVCDLVWFD